MMKVVICLLVLCVYVTSALTQTDPQLDSTWEQFKLKYQKNYDDNSEVMRRMIWEENIEKVRLHNLQYDLGLTTYSMGMNKFSDLTNAEIRNQYHGYRHQVETNSTAPIFRPVLNIEDLPKEVDWRKKGYVTPIKNQRGCGACYAFSATGSLEGQHFRKTGKLLSLSEQQIVDCSQSFNNDGCNGGYIQNTFNYIKSVGGIESETSYPYADELDKCKFQKSEVVATCTGYVEIPSGSERALQEAVATIGPVSVAINAHPHSFMSYTHGIYDNPNCSPALQNLDHAILVIGYGVENGVEYWLVKNSYGTQEWGNEGYGKMSRNKNNQCGIATAASYPTV